MDIASVTVEIVGTRKDKGGTLFGTIIVHELEDILQKNIIRLGDCLEVLCTTHEIFGRVLIELDD